MFSGDLGHTGRAADGRWLLWPPRGHRPATAHSPGEVPGCSGWAPGPRKPNEGPNLGGEDVGNITGRNGEMQEE